jgi:arginyl-tRNA---protein transferase
VSSSAYAFLIWDFRVPLIRPCLHYLSLDATYLPLGYCYYASSDSLSAQFYEDLLCRGWRRSGTLLYRPNQRASCCPQYTIRLDALAFKATKEQRQAVNRFNRFVLGEDYIKESARIHPKSREDTARRKTDFDLVERIHESESQNLKTPPKPDHEFVVTLEPNSFTEEKFALFENYQRIVHHEPPHRITKSGFRSFLCSSPLKRHIKTIAGKDLLLGSYHQCYRLDGKLVAIGVLDLLPHAVSGVYFMYHESIHNWNPGKISAMREAALAAEEGYKWYMMGFYIHSCRKMKYKVDYHPQYVLDPESHTWDLIDDEFKRRLDARRYVSLSRDKRVGIETPNANGGVRIQDLADNAVDVEHIDSDDESFSSIDDVALFSRNMPGLLPQSELTPALLDHIKLRVRGQVVKTSDLATWEAGSIDEPESIKGIIAELVAAVGTECAKNIIVSF